MRTLTSLVLALLVSAAAPASAQQDPDPAVFDQVWKLVDRHFYDRKFGGKDWRAIGDRYRKLAAACETRAAQHQLINRMLGELETSHLALVQGEVYKTFFVPELRGSKTVRAGIELAKIDGKLFVFRLYEGEPAAEHVKLGDELVAINGEPAVSSPLLLDAGNDPGIPGDPHYVIRAQAEQLALSVRRQAGAEPVVVKFTPRPTSMVTATAASVRVIDRGGWKLGYIHIWHVMSPRIAQLLIDALEGPLADCDGMILDIRGRGGRPDTMNRVMGAFHGRAAIWKRPVICLVDEASRSAKDVMAHNWKRLGIGPLVGRKTAGAVVGSTFVPLRDGSYLMLAFRNMDFLAGGVRLEGNGVVPDVVVPSKLPYAQGRDGILERGIEVLLPRLRRRY